MVIVAALAVWQEASRYLGGKRDTLLATANAFAAATGDALASRDQRSAFLALRGIASIPAIQFAELRDEAGQSVAGIGSGVRLQGDLDLTDQDGAATPFGLLTTRTVSVSVSVRKEGRTIGSLVLVGDVSDLWSRTLEALVPVALGSIAALTVGLAISLRLQRSITRPLIALTRVMSSVQADHDYGREVAIESDDEVGLLARSFGNMLREVWERDRQLVAHRDRLEQDVAERTQDLRHAKEDAEAANAAKTDFLATMSHEIRTPMNGMLVMAELLAGSDLPERQRRYAEVIARSGQSLVAIINDILDFSKIEAGKLTLERIPFSLPDLVDTVVSLFAEKANGKGLDLAAYVDPILPDLITGDPVRLTQVLGNLVNNALKFTATGHVLIAAEAVDEQLRLSVNDTGIGIPADKVNSLFSAFSQADQSTTRRFGGTGLGLAISKRIVDAMDGSVAIESVEGRGSTFSVVLPLTDRIPGRLPMPSPRRPVSVALWGAATSDVVMRGLGAAGFDVHSARAGSALAGVDTDRIADARDIISSGKPAGAGWVVAVAPIGDPAGEEAVRLGFANALLRRPVVQSEWREILERLRSGEVIAPSAVFAERPSVTPVTAVPAGLRILVVDDSAVNREVAIEALARLGIAADAVESGQAALAVSAASDFDLILMDGSMPDMDGYETTRRLREREVASGLTHVTVIALTAHVVGPAAVLWRQAGMDDVLHKPFTVAGLSEVIRRHANPGARPERDAVATLPARPASAPQDEEHGAMALLDDDTLAGLEEMAGSAGDGFIRRVVSLFADGAPPSFMELRSASAAADAIAVASAAHKLKSMAMNVGAARLASRLAIIEAAALDDAVIPETSAVDAAEHEFESTVEALRTRFDPARHRCAA